MRPLGVFGFGVLGLGAIALAFPVVVRRLGIVRGPGFVYFLLAAGTAFAVVSIVTGWGNGLTDEPFTTPRYAGLLTAGHDPYVSELVFSYQQYGATYLSRSVYLYLPLLMFLQVPGVGYKWFALACWAGLVLAVRRRFDAGTMLAQPYVVLLAASGYNDLVVLLLLTLGFAGIEGRRQRWAEYLALGVKQFANVFVVAYHAVRREWGQVGVTIVVTAAFLVPFLVWSGPAVLCPAIVANRLPGCPSGVSDQPMLNYPVYLVWAVGLFYLPARAWFLRRLPTGTMASTGLRWERLPSFLASAASGAFVALTVGIAIVVSLPSGAGPAVGAAAGAAVALVGWNAAWGGPWRTGRGRRRRALAFAVAALATVAGATGAMRLGVAPPADRLLVGVVGGTAVLVALLAMGGCVASTAEETESPPVPGAQRSSATRP